MYALLPLTNQHCSKRQGDASIFAIFTIAKLCFCFTGPLSKFRHVFERDAVVRPLCPWQILFVGVVVWALAPFVCLVCCSSLTKRKSGWDLRVVWLVCVILVCCDLPAFSDLLGLCTNDVFTAYAHVRTEPQCDIGHTREKKAR